MRSHEIALVFLVIDTSAFLLLIFVIIFMHEYSDTTKKIIHKGKFTTLWGTEFIVDGRTRVWEWLEKFDIVYILPITPDGKYVFIKQFRFPINAYVLETPAGIVEAGGILEELALKELLEETGYTTKKPLEVLPKYPISPALTNGFAYGFCARDVIQTNNKKLEDAEDIEIIELSKDELLATASKGSTEYYLDPRLLGLIMLKELRGNIDFKR